MRMVEHEARLKPRLLAAPGRFDLVDFGLRDLSRPNERLHACRRQAGTGFAHAEFQRVAAEPIVAAEFFVVVDAIVLHVLGYRARSSSRSRRRWRQPCKAK